MSIRGCIRLVAAACVCAWPAVATADVIVLPSGGELRGEIIGGPKAQGRPAAAPEGPLTIRTQTGALVTVAAGEVASVVRRRAVLEELESLRRAAADTVESHWELAEWCRERTLASERAVHLARIVELDPGHTAAHRGLGHVRHEGRWTTPDDLMTARGYVKHKGKFVLPEELALIHAEEREDAAEKEWFRQIRLWANWLDSERADRQAGGLHELRAIRDEDAVPALVRTFKDDPNEQKRLLLVEVLSQIAGDKPLKPLVQQSLRDDSSFVREASVRGVRRRDLAEALPIYLRALRNESNVTVNRAGDALGQLGDDSVVPLLIEALVTRHRYKIMVPDQSLSMGTDGSMASGAVPLPPDVATMLATGQLPYGVQVNGVPIRMKQSTIFRNEQNASVLAALNLLTGEDLGYDEQRWRNWHKQKNAGQVKSKKKSKPVK